MGDLDALILADISDVLRQHNKVQDGISDAEAVYRIRNIVLGGDDVGADNTGRKE